MPEKNESTIRPYWAGGQVQLSPGPPRMLAPDGSETLAVVLGSGAVAPNPHRFGPSGAIVVNDTPYLIDAGEGVWRGLTKASLAHDGLLMEALHPKKITKVFLTHLHSDHTVGLPALMLLPWTAGNSEPLTIFGPVGTKKLVDHLTEAYHGDLSERLNGPERKNKSGWKTIVHEIAETGQVYEDENISVEAFHHRHGSFKQNFLYRFSTKDRVIVWSGDGQSGQAFADAARNADVLFSELTTVENLKNAVWGGTSFEEKQEIIWSYHMKPKELAELATEASVKRLVLIHECNYSEPYDNLALLNELKRDYTGEAFSSRDSDVF